MALRIYSLARQLLMDSKELVDQCNRIGMEGKFSALASLTEDEAEQIRKSLGKTQCSPKTNTPPSSLRAGSSSTVVSLENLTEIPVGQDSFNLPNTHTRSDNPIQNNEQTYTLSDTSMSLGNALTIDALHAQAAELGAIVESLILKILNTSDSGPTFLDESDFCSLIDNAFDAEVFASISANDLHTARMTRNRVMHRADGSFPTDQELRQSRNAFVLAALDLLEHCGESLKAEVLSDFKQYFPRNKRMKLGKKTINGADRPEINQPRDL